MKTFTINEASSKMNLTPFYVRKCIREGKIQSTLEQIGDTKVQRHTITEEEITRFETRDKRQVGKRDDGRNKYTIYLTPRELETFQDYINDPKNEEDELLEAYKTLIRSNVKKS